MSEPNPNESGGWQMYEVLVVALCVGLTMWGMLSGTSAVRAQSIAAKRSDTREKVRESTDAKSEKALTTFTVSFASSDENKTLFRVPLDLAMAQDATRMENNATGFRELILSRAPDPGYELFVAKGCIGCHQTDPAVPALGGIGIKAPAFMGDFWGKEREVEIDGDPSTSVFEASGKFEKVLMDETYFLESIEKPMAKIVKDSIAGMAPQPTTADERKMLMEYVKSLSEEK